jgi:hypothetical protein
MAYPQGLKPESLWTLYGTAEAVPLQSALNLKDSVKWCEAVPPESRCGIEGGQGDDTQDIL